MHIRPDALVIPGLIRIFLARRLVLVDKVSGCILTEPRCELDQLFAEAVHRLLVHISLSDQLREASYETSGRISFLARKEKESRRGNPNVWEPPIQGRVGGKFPTYQEDEQDALRHMCRKVPWVPCPRWQSTARESHDTGSAQIYEYWKSISILTGYLIY